MDVNFNIRPRKSVLKTIKTCVQFRVMQYSDVSWFIIDSILKTMFSQTYYLKLSILKYAYLNYFECILYD